MLGKSRPPGGEPRKASQRQRRLSAPSRAVIERSWRPGDQVRWREYTGQFLRETADDQVEVLIGKRTYRVDRDELKLA